ncbi:efflux RND transporter periplasmic adaptor subunit [Cognatishimia sp. F0-27]|uniref:efflux RND transporter periplasmic adaptor subunit n=1 Tax=Cognatishimia sp. F0-27 TaxID=2816855 RepID=UPI001D0C56C7|nr:efflux RND transporter periplasmic adaptor subunit [Cognatishimia sp. F0-27]MCC1492032.1 efflux RND transporter periplasmic adaptor subunit [Cognatishimia sp. F0-27]
MAASKSSQDSDTRPQPLSFDDDPGSNRATWVAAVLLVAIVGWMGSGFILPSEDVADSGPAAGDRDNAAPVAVAIRPSQAEAVTLFFQAEGQAQPDRDTSIRAEASGDVAELIHSKGDDVEAGAVIARLDTARVEADLRRAEEERVRAQREFDNATELRDRGVATVDRVTQARAALAAADAQVASARSALDATEIRAPFAGRIETLTLDPGEFVTAGAEIGRIVDNRPLTVALQVPQQALTRISNGQPAQVSFITGETREGEVTFVGTSASAETRTFLTEITVPNEDGAIPAGISAEIRIPTGQAQAHFISPSIVSLSPEGATGVKTVEDGRVVFHEIAVARAEVDGIWVTGLPDQADLIVVGQGFVREGEVVRAQPEIDAGTGPTQ